MKNIFFLFAFIGITTLSFAQKVTLPEGVRKADLPVVYLADNLSVHFISPEPIQYVDISSKGITGDLPVKNILRIRYKTDDQKEPGGDAVVTIVGEKFIAQYHVVYSVPDGGAIQTDIDVTPADTKPIDIGFSLSQPEIQSFAAKMLYSGGRHHLQHSKAFGLHAWVNQVYTLGDYVFLDIGYKNTTRLPYEIEGFRFKINDKKITKATTVQSLEVKPEYELFDQPFFKRYYRNIFVFKKFTFPGNKVLQVELSEKQLSGRVISLEIPYKDILGADTVPFD